MIKRSLRTELTLVMAVVVLITVGLISVLTNIFINRQFEAYKTDQQTLNMQEIAYELGEQYNSATKEWNTDAVNIIGMEALYNGYIISLADLNNNIVWNAKQCNMMLCSQKMSDIISLMKRIYPKSKGSFIDKTFYVPEKGTKVGNVTITYYGPFFINQNDFEFLKTLNKILSVIGALSLLISVIIGFFIAKKLSRPILKTAAAAKKISAGDYSAKMDEITGLNELNELMASINNLAASLLAQENLRQQLTADVAHELRTPVTTLQTHIEAMTMGIWEPTKERLQSCFDEILRLGKLISDLESVAKIESGNLKLQKAPTNLFNIISKIVSDFEIEINKKELKVAIEGYSQDIAVDKDRISQVVINLMSNSIKYTSNGGSIDIRIYENDTSAFISVKDNGSGIPENDLPYIFERFYRADKSRNRLTGGSGIGLTVVKSIVDAHGGSIKVASKLNEGSEFIVELPK